jgi:hypothetical protein
VVLHAALKTSAQHGGVPGTHRRRQEIGGGWRSPTKRRTCHAIPTGASERGIDYDYQMLHPEYFSRREVLKFLFENRNRMFGRSEEECWSNAWKIFSFGMFDGDLGFLRDEFFHICKFYGFHPERDGGGNYRLMNPRIEMDRKP